MFRRLWGESWDQGIWITPWSKAINGLTPAQAAWSPAPGRHSIWQNINHVSIWREYTLTKIDGRPGPTRDDMTPRNFEHPAAPEQVAWDAARARLRQSHDAIAALLAEPRMADAPHYERLCYHLPHDAYHLGQIMQLRALLGLPPIE